MWRGYWVCERSTLGVNNRDALLALFDAMGTHDSPFLMNNNHYRIRLDGDAKLYESNFDPAEVSITQFKQLLAGEFGVPVEDIDNVTTQDDYAGFGTTVWTFSYNSIDRCVMCRFGGGGTWAESNAECLGYLKLYQAEWEPLEE